MKPIVATATAAVLLLSAPALAASDNPETATAAPTGDVAAGEEAFAKQCTACHVVKSDDGEVLAGKRGRTGPNLYGVMGGTVGTVEGFKFSKSMAEMADTDIVWTEENFVTYVQNPTDWLREKLDDKKARSKMSWRVRDPQEAADIYAFLHSIAPAKAE
ncbi:c-type cytochrome [Roseovarius sp. Pro17]|uniref:c-type cytochrome n=1 Tax=Roseovarius sp. Pro17 TaxID=3108175 RepID=UPI002D7A22E9|nr:c-type cytochrome [Roseovarius sp. Pro17]